MERRRERVDGNEDAQKTDEESKGRGRKIERKRERRLRLT
jgi:hypothetical protein